MPLPDSQSAVQPGSTSPARHRRVKKSSSKKSALSTLAVKAENPVIRNPANRLWTETSQRDVFFRHLANWASNHDSSTYFHGRISLRPQGSLNSEAVGLGKSVNCFLTDTSSPGEGKAIVVRLFQSQRHSYRSCVRGSHKKHESTGFCSARDTNSTCACPRCSGNDSSGVQEQSPDTHYRLVIRSGSSWVPAREYLNKHYFARNARKSQEHKTFEAIAQAQDVDQYSSRQSCPKQTVSTPCPKNSVKICPLFRPFLRLPPELQDTILYEALGYTRTIILTRHTTEFNPYAPTAPKPAITVSKLFSISKNISEHMIPHIFRSTNFHFGVTGFTSFLWQLGPRNRSKLQHLTFHFGRASLLHCIRWLAPDAIYELFEPPVATNPVNLMYFWRCQIQDLMKELNLLTLTIDIQDVPPQDVPMYTRILSTAFGSVERVRCTGGQMTTGNKPIITRKGSLQQEPKLTWRDMSVRYFHSYRSQKFYMRRVWQIQADSSDFLQQCMDKNKVFFDS